MKIWFDLCEPKAVIMLQPLYQKLIVKHEVFITARDFDATFDLLDAWSVPYYKVGLHGGSDLMGKLKSYSDRLSGLIPIVEKEKPQFLFGLTSPEGARIAYGLNIPHIMFNDEPRSIGVCKLSLPLVYHLIVPKPIPIDWFTQYGIESERITRFNGIDEVGWLNREWFHPSDQYAKDLGLVPEKYLVCRTEATQSYAHIENRLAPHDTKLTYIIPQLMQKFMEKGMDYKFLLLPRYKEQYDYLLTFFAKEIEKGLIVLRRSVSHLADIMYYSAIVLSGGGTMVRESGLLGIPSIEFIQTSRTYPQEQFLIDNGFPLVHVDIVDEVVQKTLEFLENQKKESTWDKIAALDNPVELAYEKFKKFMALSD